MAPLQSTLSAELFNLFTGSAGDTWAQTLNRLERFYRCNVDEYVDEDSGETYILNFSEKYAWEEVFQVHAPMSMQELAAYESRYGMPVPSDLRRLLAEQGGFTLFPEERTIYFSFFSSTDPLFPNIKTLPDALCYYGARHFLEEEFNDHEREMLAQRYCCFADCTLSDSDHTFLIFDRQGRYGVNTFISEDYPFSRQNLEPLLNGQMPFYTLDELIRRSVNWAIYRALDNHEVPIDEQSQWASIWNEHLPTPQYWSLP